MVSAKVSESSNEVSMKAVNFDLLHLFQSNLTGLMFLYILGFHWLKKCKRLKFPAHLISGAVFGKTGKIFLKDRMQRQLG